MESENTKDIATYCYHICDLAMQSGFEKENLLKALGLVWDKLEEAEDRNAIMVELSLLMMQRSMQKLERLEKET